MPRSAMISGLLAAANRHLRAVWARLVAEEAQHRSIGFFLR